MRRQLVNGGWSDTVQAAIAEIEACFAPSPLIVEPDGQGGARVIIEQAELDAPYAQPITWIGAHLPAQLPYSDVYPLFVRGDLQRGDGSSLVAPITPGHTFMNRPAVQVSRRSNRVDLNTQSAAMKFQKVLHWMRSL